MTTFEFETNSEIPEIAVVEIDRRFNIAIERTESGLSLRIYPRTAGELWDAPFESFDVDEDQIRNLEADMED